jgi:predicted esterase
MQRHIIQTERTARYFTLGNLNEKTKRVYFLLHGYAQNADEFLNSFIDLADNETLLIAPEGLSHFYFKDLFQQPVSSWMTSLERENEVTDYVHYLQKVYSEVLGNVDCNNLIINYIGFSQGCATLSRWLNAGNTKMNHVVLYAGEIGSEIDFTDDKFFAKKCNLHIVYGEDDRFIRMERLQEISNLLSKENVNFIIEKTTGRHVVSAEGVCYIIENTKY